MPERPRPDIEHTREALRQHDERVVEDEAEEAEEAKEAATDPGEPETDDAESE
jgi:hypothetical protein